MTELNVYEPETLTEEDLFKRLVKLETDKLTLMDDIKQLKKDASYDGDMNPKGINKEDIKLIAKAAVLEAKNNFDEVRVGTEAVFEKYKELTKYDE